MFNLHLSHLTPFVTTRPELSAFAREIMEASAAEGMALPKQWLEKRGEDVGTMADAGRACVTIEAAHELLEVVERYKSGRANSQPVEQTVWAALGYESTSTASSRVDREGSI